MAGVAACRDARGTASTGVEQTLEAACSVRRTPDGGRAPSAVASRRPVGEQGRPAEGEVNAPTGLAVDVRAFYAQSVVP